MPAVTHVLWIVPKDSPLGRHLASFTDDEWRRLHAYFEARFEALTIEEETEGRHHGNVYVEFPRYEIIYPVELLHTFTLERVAACIRPPAQTE